MLIALITAGIPAIFYATESASNAIGHASAGREEEEEKVGGKWFPGSLHDCSPLGALDSSPS